VSKTMVVMAAGLGSRYGGDKQVVGVGPSNEILLEYSVYDSIKAGFDKIIIIIKYGLESIVFPIVDKMKSVNPEIEFCIAYQDSSKPFEGVEISKNRTKPLGTVHALLSAKEMIESDFGVINADDFYGRAAFDSLSNAMDKFDKNINSTLITYSLNKTLSNNGTVTRGICRVENEMLRGIYESYKIRTGDDGVIYELLDGELSALPPETPVSMNMWGFSKDTLPHMVDYLKEFLVNLESNDNSSECILPVMVGDLMASEVFSVSAFATNENWFGITYREDLKDAADELKMRHIAGTYPKQLY